MEGNKEMTKLDSSRSACKIKNESGRAKVVELTNYSVQDAGDDQEK